MRGGIRTSFLLQALLIVLPFVLLASYGIWALQVERQQLAEQTEATATRVLQDIGPLLGESLSAGFSEYVEATTLTDEIFRIALEGTGQTNGASPSQMVDLELAKRRNLERDGIDHDYSILGRCLISYESNLLPRDFPIIPLPPAWVSMLSSNEWFSLGFQCSHPDATANQCADELSTRIDSQTNPHVIAELELRRLELFSDNAVGRSNLIEYAIENASAISSAGLPLADLALIRYVRGIEGASELDQRYWALASQRIRNHPSILTELWVRELLRHQNLDRFSSGINPLHTLSMLDRHRASRRLLESYPRYLLTRGEMHLAGIKSGEHSYVAVSVPRTSNGESVENLFDVFPIPQDTFSLLVESSIGQIADRIPEFYQVRFGLNGREFKMGSPEENTEQSTGEILRSGFTEVFVTPASSTQSLRVPVSIVLADPAGLFRGHQQRVWITGGLLVLACLTAGVGLWQTFTNLRRQLALNDMKTNFVSSVSHELRAPIASVRLMAENLERGNVTGESKVKEYVGFIGQECRRLSSLIENVLDFSRIEQGRKQYELEPTDLTKLVEDTVRLMNPYAEERGVMLVFRTGGGAQDSEGQYSCRPDHQESSSRRTPIADAQSTPDSDDRSVAHPFVLNLDGRAIQQALINLIDNAIKHSPAGQAVEICLQCRTGFQPVSGESNNSTLDQGLDSRPDRNETADMAVRLSITDHGPGIPVEERQKIFERFYRRGSELRRETQGIGIGLSIVKHVIEGHDGKVWVENPPEKGSRFVIELQPQMDTDER